MPRNTSADVRSTNLKIKMAKWFAEERAEYEDSEGYTIVFEDDDCVIVADHTGHELNEWCDEFDLDRSELSAWMHEQARSLCGYDWSASDPIIFDKLEN